MSHYHIKDLEQYYQAYRKSVSDPEISGMKLQATIFCGGRNGILFWNGIFQNQKSPGLKEQN